MTHDIVHSNTIADHLHQIFVRGYDGNPCPHLLRTEGEGGDNIIGFKAFHLQSCDIKGTGGIAHQGELNDQILWRGWAVGFIVGENIVAEGFALMVKNNRQMGGGVCARLLFHHFIEHIGKAAERADGEFIGFTGERRQGVIGAKDKTRAINKVEVMPLCQSHDFVGVAFSTKRQSQ